MFNMHVMIFHASGEMQTEKRRRCREINIFILSKYFVRSWWRVMWGFKYRYKQQSNLESSASIIIDFA